LSFRVGWYSYVTTILLGLIAPLFLAPLLRSEGGGLLKGLSAYLAVYAVLGIALGVTWYGIGWRWGLWLVAPLSVLVVLSLLFAGGIHLFLLKDLPVTVAAAAAACVGAYVGARFAH
jgi:hypothetical protein